MDLNSRLITLGSGSVAGGAAASDYWILSLNGDQTDDVSGVRIKGGTNKQSFAIVDNQNKLTVLCIDGDGAITWKKQVSSEGSNSGGTMGSTDIAVDSSDNVYAVGYTFKGAVSWSNYDGFVVKYNSSGVVQWQKRYGDQSYTEYYYSVVVDSAGNVICNGQSGAITGGGLLHVKYTSSGTISVKKVLGGTALDPFRSVKAFLDSDGTTVNLICRFRSGSYRPVFVKLNTSTGNDSFTKYVNVTNNSYSFGGAQDSSDNLISVGRDVNIQYGLIVKLAANGASFLWQKKISISSSSELTNAFDAVCDSSDNIYVCGYWRHSSTNAVTGYIIKYNSSGVVQWGRQLSHSDDYLELRGIDLDSEGNLAITGNIRFSAYSENSALILKLPSDGSLTGTHGDFTYSSTSVTEPTSSYSLTGQGHSTISSSEGNGNSGNTFGDASFSSTSLTTL